jgi:hypothetical protein
MIKKILLVSLWTAALTLCVPFIAALIFIAYLRVTLHGAAPSEHQHQSFVTILTFLTQITVPIALLIGVFGFLPGTRLKTTSPSPSKWAKWCYRFCVAVALFAMLVSLCWDSTIWDVLGTTPMIFALGVALIDKYTQKRSIQQAPLHEFHP